MQSDSSLRVTQLHPLIREQLPMIDLRRTDILRVENGVVVDLIVRNAPRRARS
jgi:hypothetical protein